MNNKALLEEIAKHATILDYHIKRLKKKPDQLHEIDIDLLGGKLKEIYSLTLELTAGNPVEEKLIVEKEEETVAKDTEEQVQEKPEPVPEPESAPVPRSVSPKAVPDPEPKLEPEPEPKLEPEPEPKPEPDLIPEIKNEARPEPEPEPEPELKHAEEVNTELPEPVYEREPMPERKTTADLFSGTATIADSFQAENDNSIAATVNPHAIQDLKKAIGINDKFLFINELFQGDPAVYNQAIENLNAMAGMSDADTAINGYRTEYSWADNSEAYHRLKKIVMSKFDA